MDAIQLTTPIAQALQEVWLRIIAVIPAILGALIVFILGLLVAAILEVIVSRLIKAIKLDKLLTKAGLEECCRRAGLRLDSGRFLGKIVYWFIVIAFILAASEILKLTAFSDFLRQVLVYIPNIIIAILIVLATVIVASFLRGLVKASVKTVKIEGVSFLGALTWWVVVIFGASAAMTQLGIATTIINIVAMGIVVMLAIAGGIAFGLGGKEHAASLIEKIKGTFEK